MQASDKFLYIICVGVQPRDSPFSVQRVCVGVVLCCSSASLLPFTCRAYLTSFPVFQRAFAGLAVLHIRDVCVLIEEVEVWVFFGGASLTGCGELRTTRLRWKTGHV